MDVLGGFADSETYGYAPDFGGWNIDLEPIEPGTITFKPGDTICVDNNNIGSTVYFRVSGEVDLVNKNEIGEGYVLWGNSTPVAFDITQVEVLDADGNLLEEVNAISVQKMDVLGGFADSEVYSYAPDFGGWNIDLEPIESGVLVLNPGEAVCIDNNNLGAKVIMKVPSPITK